jgi:hypothetical protein
MVATFINLAFLFTATTYGYDEPFCGDAGNPPLPCSLGGITASGELFNPETPMVAVWMPTNYRLRRGMRVCMRHKDGYPVWLPVLDKKGRRGFDLTPAAVAALGHEPTPYWSATLKPCIWRKDI